MVFTQNNDHRRTANIKNLSHYYSGIISKDNYLCIFLTFKTSVVWCQIFPGEKWPILQTLLNFRLLLVFNFLLHRDKKNKRKRKTSEKLNFNYMYIEIPKE